MTDIKEKNDTKTTIKKIDNKKENTEKQLMEKFMKELEELKRQNEELIKQIDNKKDEEEKKKDKPKRKVKVSLKDIRNEEVTVQRVIGGMGSVHFVDVKTGDEYVWAETGDTEVVTVDVLKRMVGKNSMYLKTPWLKIIDSDDAVEALGLKSLYRALELTEDIDTLLKMSDSEINNLVNKLSQDYKESMAINIQTKILSGELTNVHTIRKLERLLEKEFML